MTSVPPPIKKSHIIYFFHPACSGSRSAWRPASCAVARRRCGWIPTKPMRSPTQTLVSWLFLLNCTITVIFGLRPVSCIFNNCVVLYLRPADPKTGKGWIDHQETSDGSFPGSLPQEHNGPPQGTSHGLWCVEQLISLTLFSKYL